MSYGNSDFVPVILGSGLGAYAIARSLHEAYGVRSLALGRDVLRECADSAIVDVETPRDFDTADGVVSALNAVADRFTQDKLVLFPTIEFYTNIVIEQRDRINPRLVSLLVQEDLAARLMNKTEFYQTCAELGVAYPATVVVPPGDFDGNDLGEGLPFEYPVVIKPGDTDLYQQLDFPGKKKVYLVDSPASLREVVIRIAGSGYDGDLIIQEFLSGDESVMQVANTYSNADGKLVFSSIGQVVLAEVNPRRVGNYNSIMSIQQPALAQDLATLLDTLGYRGPANFDVMYDPKTNTSKLLEINLRLGASHFYVNAAGGNIARDMVDELVYGTTPPSEAVGGSFLWLNVPYLAVRRFAPRNLRAQVKSARKNGALHTLRYKADRTPRRLISVQRNQLRHLRDLFKFRKLNQFGQ